MYRKHKPKPLFLQGEIDTVSPEIVFKQFDNRLWHLFGLFNIKTMLHRVGICKLQGFPAFELFYLWILHPFFKNTRRCLWNPELTGNKISAGKDAFYRFLANSGYNWRNLVYQLFFQIQRHLKRVPHKERLLVADTTLIKKTGRNIELVSRMFDHVSKKHILCFPTLFLGYFDGRSFFPLDFAVSATKSRPNNRKKRTDKRSCGYKRRQEADSKTTFNLISMLKRAYNKGVDASYLLFDSWFAHDAVISQVVETGYHVICRCKSGGRARYVHQGKRYTAKKLFSKVARKLLKWQPEIEAYAAKVRVTLPNTGEVTLVFCQSEPKAKFVMFLSTDNELELLEIINKYSKRWSVEMFFKDAKQYLGLGKEHNRNFDAVIAHCSFVLIRYNFLSFIIRVDTYREAIGTLFHELASDVIQKTVVGKLWDFFKNLLHLSSQLLLEEGQTDIAAKLTDYIDNIINPSALFPENEGAKL